MLKMGIFTCSYLTNAKKSPYIKKKQKIVVSRKEPIDLSDKVNMILSVISNLQPPQHQPMIPPNTNSLAKRVNELEEREKLLDERILLNIEMGIKSLDESIMKWQAEMVQKGEEMVKQLKELKEDTVKSYVVFEKKINVLLNETQNAYDIGYVELQTTVMDLEKKICVLLQVLPNVVAQATKLTNDPKKTHDEIIQLSKDILKHLHKSLILTNNEVNVKNLFGFA